MHPFLHGVEELSILKLTCTWQGQSVVLDQWERRARDQARDLAGETAFLRRQSGAMEGPLVNFSCTYLEKAPSTFWRWHWYYSIVPKPCDVRRALHTGHTSPDFHLA